MKYREKEEEKRCWGMQEEDYVVLYLAILYLLIIPPVFVSYNYGKDPINKYRTWKKVGRKPRTVWQGVQALFINTRHAIYSTVC